MPRKNALSQKELEICQRLLAARKFTQIPRVAFARKVGIDSTVMVRYEHNRVPVRYAVFAKISKHFPLNPYWLATGDSTPFLEKSVDDSDFANSLHPGALFSEVYDAYLKPRYEPAAHDVGKNLFKAREALEELCSILEDDDIPKELMEEIERRIRPLTEALRKRLAMTSLQIASSQARLEGITDLTKTSEFRNTPSNMKAAIEILLDKVRKLTSPTGMKAKLAAELKVPQSRVSEWLSGKHEPGGEVALQMLKWVELQERGK